MIDVQIDVVRHDDGDDGSTRVWFGSWQTLPPVGSTLELREMPGRPVETYRVLGYHSIVWIAVDGISSVIVWVEEIDPADAAPRPTAAAEEPTR